MPSHVYTTMSNAEDICKHVVGMALRKDAEADAPPPLALCTGLGKREAQIDHELLVDHAC